MLLSAAGVFGQIRNFNDTSLSQCECTKYYSPESFLSIVLLNDNKIDIIDEAESYSTGERIKNKS